MTVDLGTSEATVPSSAGEFDLDISIFETGSGLAELIRMTDDGCGTTCESACNSCTE